MPWQKSAGTPPPGSGMRLALFSFMTLAALAGESKTAMPTVTATPPLAYVARSSCLQPLWDSDETSGPWAAAVQSVVVAVLVRG